MASFDEVRGWAQDGSLLARLHRETPILQMRGGRVVAHPPRWIRFLQNRDEILERLVEVVVSLQEAEKDKENLPRNGQTPGLVVARRVGAVL